MLATSSLKGLDTSVRIFIISGYPSAKSHASAVLSCIPACAGFGWQDHSDEQSDKTTSAPATILRRSRDDFVVTDAVSRGPSSLRPSACFRVPRVQGAKICRARIGSKRAVASLYAASRGCASKMRQGIIRNALQESYGFCECNLTYFM